MSRQTVGEKTETKLKPWSELTAFEKQIAIAICLGCNPYQLSGGYPCCGCKNQEHMDRYGEDRRIASDPPVLPEWHKDDGLAFAEVWPKIGILEPNLHMLYSDGQPSICDDNSLDRDYYNLGKYSYHGDSWADLICRAAYELLPEAK